MCGIAGATRSMLGDNPGRVLNQMNEVMVHRGPDAGDLFYDDNMGLCHRRLSIIDLSDDGKQPMKNDDGRYVIVFNGEIYNFLELREELKEAGLRESVITNVGVAPVNMEFARRNSLVLYGKDANEAVKEIEKTLDERKKAG